VGCPTCGRPAEISDRFTLGGAPGPLEHVKVVCVRRHWHTLPVDMFPVSPPVSQDMSTSGMNHDLLTDTADGSRPPSADGRIAPRSVKRSHALRLVVPRERFGDIWTMAIGPGRR